MKTREAIMSVLTILALALVGCSDARHQQGAKERERKRIEAEERAQRDVQKANRAITEMGMKIGRPARTPDLNLPHDKAAPPASEKP